MLLLTLAASRYIDFGEQQGIWLGPVGRFLEELGADFKGMKDTWPV